MPKRVEGNRILSRIKYFFGDKDVHHYGGVTDAYSARRHYAETCEEEAKSVTAPAVRGSWYEKAARNWLSSKEEKKAAEDYLNASHSWRKLANMHEGDREESVYRKRADKNMINARRLLKVSAGKWHGLEGKASATTAIIGLIGGLFFLSSNITGNVIGLNQSTGNILGAVLLVVGLVGSFFWFRSRKR